MATPILYNDILDGDQFHNDEVHQGDLVFPGINSPHYVTIDTEAAARRNLGYIQENIARRIQREKKAAQ